MAAPSNEVKTDDLQEKLINIRRVAKVHSDKIRMLQTGENEELATLVSDGTPIRMTMEMMIGGGTKRPELGEVSLSREVNPGEFEILGMQFPLRCSPVQ